MPGLVALTGATGFIGGAFLAELSATGWQVKALTRQLPPKNCEAVTWIRGDLHDEQALTELVDNTDFVIHCAGIVRGSSEKDFIKTNVEGTANLVRVILKKKSATRVLHVSSLAAREHRLSWYAESKYLSEQEIRKLTELHSWVIFRPTAVYGPGDTEIKPLFSAMKSGFLPVPSVRGAKFGLIHIDDLTAAMMKWLSSESAISGVYELDDGTVGGYNWDRVLRIARDTWHRRIYKLPVPVSVLSLSAKINLCLARLFKYSPMLTPGKIQELKHTDWTCNNNPLTEKLGWEPEINLSESMQKGLYTKSKNFKI